MELKSRILKYINKDLMIKLNSIAHDVLIRDNNEKFDRMLSALKQHEVPFEELGIGTNRCAVLIEGYVFKIGMDKAGIADNWSEFSLSQELQPFVTKTYECNGLIAVSEYITVISKEEFTDNSEEVRQILSHLAEGYLLGDVGSVTKNFMNWGFRADNSLVILDYAYIYRVIGDELMCDMILKDDTECKTPLDYDINFNKLICPKCRREYTFHQIRRKISKEYEQKEKDTIKQLAYKLTKPSQEFNIAQTTNIEIQIESKGEDDIMGKNKYKSYDEYEETETSAMDEYYAAINMMMNDTPAETHEEVNSGELIEDMSEINEAVETLTDEDNIESYESTEDEDDDNDLTVEDVMAIIDDTSIEEKMNELEQEDSETVTVIEEPVEEVKADIETVEVETGSIVSVDVADDPFEEVVPVEEETTVEVPNHTLEEIKENDHDVKIFDPEEGVPPVEETNNITIIVGETDKPVVTNVKVENVSTSNTVQMTVNDTLVFTSPDNVDEMRKMLSADIEDEDDKYSEYDDMYDGTSFQKIPKSKRSFE